jgi:hypothetical protein
VRARFPSPVAPQKLEAAGFMTRGDLENIGPIDLARGALLERRWRCARADILRVCA